MRSSINICDLKCALLMFYCLIYQWKRVKSLSCGCVCRSRCLRMWTWALSSFVWVPLTLTLASLLLLNTAWWTGKASLPSNHPPWVCFIHTHIVYTAPSQLWVWALNLILAGHWDSNKHFSCADDCLHIRDAFLSHPVLNAVVSRKQTWPHSTIQHSYFLPNHWLLSGSGGDLHPVTSGQRDKRSLHFDCRCPWQPWRQSQ